MQAQVQLRCYSVEQTAIALGVSKTSVRRLVRRGLLRPLDAMRHLRIPVEQIDVLVKATSER